MNARSILARAFWLFPTSQPLVLEAMRAVGVFASFEALAVVGLLLLIVTLEEQHLAFAIEVATNALAGIQR